MSKNGEKSLVFIFFVKIFGYIENYLYLCGRNGYGKITF